MHIAIVGCGQLARMLALAGWPMGLRFSFLANTGEDTRCVEGLGNVVRVSDFHKPAALYEALGRPNVITVEKEAVDISLLKSLQKFCVVAPDPKILAICKHRAREKRYVNSRGVATVRYRQARNADELKQAAAYIGLPLIIKSCEQGYDGQQQWTINSKSELGRFVSAAATQFDVVAESRLNFYRELSVIAVRSIKGDIAIYAPTENWHRRGTLLTSVAPAENLNNGVQKQLEKIVHKLLGDWNYVGVLAIECFEMHGDIIVNELAPRVHNSGHWTQQGAITSQFENHLRAITGLSLGSVKSQGYHAMLNLLGCEAPLELINYPQAHVHMYNKLLRFGRKMGHVNLCGDDRAQLKQELNMALNLVYDRPVDRVA